MDPVTAQQLVNKVAALESQVAMLEQRLLGRPKARLPDPEKFTGAARYDTWLPLIKAKLRIDADAIGNDEAQFFYLYGNLDSKIQAMVLPQLLQAERTMECGTSRPSSINSSVSLTTRPNEIRLRLGCKEFDKGVTLSQSISRSSNDCSTKQMPIRGQTTRRSPSCEMVSTTNSRRNSMCSWNSPPSTKNSSKLCISLVDTVVLDRETRLAISVPDKGSLLAVSAKLHGLVSQWIFLQRICGKTKHSGSRVCESGVLFGSPLARHLHSDRPDEKLGSAYDAAIQTTGHQIALMRLPHMLRAV